MSSPCHQDISLRKARQRRCSSGLRGGAACGGLIWTKLDLDCRCWTSWCFFLLKTWFRRRPHAAGSVCALVAISLSCLDPEASCSRDSLCRWTLSCIYILVIQLVLLQRQSELHIPTSEPLMAAVPGSRSRHPDNRFRLWLMNTVSAAEPFPSSMCWDSFSPLSRARPEACENGDLINNVCEGRSKEGLLRSLCILRGTFNSLNYT